MRSATSALWKMTNRGRLCRPSLVRSAERSYIATPLRSVGTIQEATIVRDSLSRAAKEQTERLEHQLHQALSRYQAITTGRSSEQRHQSLVDLRSAYEALQYWDQALEIEQLLLQEYTSGDLDEAENLYRQGKLHMRMQELSKAQKLFQQALDGYHQHANGTATSPEIGNILISMAGIHYHRQRLVESLQLLYEAETYFDKQSTVLVKCWQHQGLLHRSMEQFDQALDCYERSLQLVQEIEPHNVEKKSSLQLDIADMMAALDRHEPALQAYQALSTINDAALQSVVFHSIGKLQAVLSQPEKARDSLQQSLTIKQSLVDPTHPEIGTTLQTLGAVHAMLGDKRKALECFQQALLIARMHAENPESDPSVLYGLRNIAVLNGEKVAKWGDDTRDAIKRDN